MEIPAVSACEQKTLNMAKGKANKGLQVEADCFWEGKGCDEGRERWQEREAQVKGIDGI